MFLIGYDADMDEPLIGILYARKSTDSEDKQAQSINNQLTDMRAASRLRGIPLTEEITESMSAKRPGRPGLDRALRLVEQGKANCLVAWHPDRLARNAFDAGRIIDLFDQGKLRRIQCYHAFYENNPQDKMMLQTQFVFAKHANDLLSERVRGAHRLMLARGEYPGGAYFGYVRNFAIRKHVVDRRFAPLVLESFERYRRGATNDDLRAFLFKKGAKSRHGKMLGHSFVSRMLSNPFYHGAFDWAGAHYQGCHEPIVPKALFDEVQALLRKRDRYSSAEIVRVVKPYLGVAHCGECGRAFTAEIQKGHTYYRCTKKSRLKRCSQRYIREEELDAQIARLLSPFALGPAAADRFLLQLATDQLSYREINSHMIRDRVATRNEAAARFARVKDSLFRGIIAPEDADEERKRYLETKRVMDDAIAALTRGEDIWLEPMRDWVLKARNLAEVAITGSRNARATAAKEIFGSNLLIEGKKARGKAAKPWSLIPETALGDTLVPLYAAARTHFQGREGCPDQESNLPPMSPHVSPRGDTA